MGFGRGAQARFLAIDELLRFVARPTQIFEQLISVFAAFHRLLQMLERNSVAFLAYANSDRRPRWAFVQRNSIHRSNSFPRQVRPGSFYPATYDLCRSDQLRPPLLPVRLVIVRGLLLTGLLLIGFSAIHRWLTAGLFAARVADLQLAGSHSTDFRRIASRPVARPFVYWQLAGHLFRRFPTCWDSFSPCRELESRWPFSVALSPACPVR